MSFIRWPRALCKIKLHSFDKEGVCVHCGAETGRRTFYRGEAEWRERSLKRAREAFNESPTLFYMNRSDWRERCGVQESEMFKGFYSATSYYAATKNMNERLVAPGDALEALIKQAETSIINADTPPPDEGV